MITAKDVAAYMTFELKRRRGVLYQADIADWIMERFGREFVIRGAGPYLKVREDVRREFHALNPDVVWDVSIFGWRTRVPGFRDPGTPQPRNQRK
jgi:hypothetical protein